MIFISRDWTPQEQYQTTLILQNQYNNSFSLLDNKFEIAIINETTKEKIPFYTKKEKEVFSKFKNLGFLFSDNLYCLWEKTSSNPNREKVLLEVEREIENIISFDLEKRNLCSFDKTIVEWYLGKLDKNFYYCEKNNKLFEDYLYKKIVE